MNILRKLPLAMMVGLIFSAGSAHAQLSGNGIGGDFGMKSGSQPPPGFYLGYMAYNYDTSRIVTQGGQEISLQGSLQAWAHLATIWLVTDRRILGANYSAMTVLPFNNLTINAPRLDLTTRNYGFGDLYVQPINLGWHTKRADVMTWYGFFAPTGSQAHQTGLGMWSHELAVGGTFYLNEKRTWHASALPVFEFHGKKQNSDVRVGNILTLKGGVGKTSKQILDVGMAYYAQWKLTDDSGLGLPPIVQNRLGKNRNFGLGPEASLVLPLKKDLTRLMIFDIKYFFETGTVLDTKGRVLVMTITFKLL